MDLGNVNGNCYALVDLILHVCVCVFFFRQLLRYV